MQNEEQTQAVTFDEIARLVGGNALHAGQAYWAEGRVGPISFSTDRQIISASVRGSRRDPYRQTIRITTTGGSQRSLLGSCTCPVGYNCKHIAAVLLGCLSAHRPVPDDRAGSQQAPLPSGQQAGSRMPAQALPSPVEEALPPDVEAWLRGLEAAQEDETDDYPPTVRKRLLYVLERATHSGGPMVSLASIELKRDGSISGTVRRHAPREFTDSGQPPKFLRPVDRSIMAGLARSSSRDGAAELPDLLRRIIATGRGRWGAWDGPVVTEGSPLPGRLTWALSEDGRQRPMLELPDPVLALNMIEPWYADPRSGAVGPVQTEVPPRLLRAMLAAPSVSAGVAGRVRAEMMRRVPDAAVPVPRELAPPQRVREKLRPHLALLAGELPMDPWKLAQSRHGKSTLPGELHSVPLARLSFQYGPVTLPTPVSRDIVVQGGQLLSVVRDAAGEARAWERLHQIGLQIVKRLGVVMASHPHANDLVLVDPDPGSWIDFVLHDVPALRAEGWDVEIGADFPLRLAEPEGDVTISIDESSGIDWFDVELGVMVDGVRVNLVPVLRRLLADPDFMTLIDGHADSESDMPVLLPLQDGRLLNLPMTRLQPILAPLLELFQDTEDGDAASGLRLPRHRAADLALLESADTSLAWSGGEALRALGRQLRATDGIPPCGMPDGFGAVLRPYQAQGLAWLQFLASAGLGGVLADDMGLGKTVQALAHIAVEQAQGRLDRPVLVVCPTSVVPTWRTEAARFAPLLRVLVLNGPYRARNFSAIPRHDVVITSYPLLSRDHAVLAAQAWHLVVLDEAQTIKNPAATTSKLARTLDARLRLCLSGTPLENHLGELWSLFDFLMPGFLGNRQQFGRRYRGPIEKAGNAERQALLARRVAPFLLRRTKAEVAADLPPRTMIAETVEMEPAQRSIYEGIRVAMHSRVRQAIAERGLASSGIIILDALLKLRQACCDPRLLKLSTAKSAKAGSAKLERLLEILPQMLEEGRRVLLFSQFTSMLALIEAELVARNLPYALLTGETRNRESVVSRFQNREVPLFLISLKAGGVGLTLTAADTVIHYDPWWNPAVEDQATDRAHRIGQDKPVFVHRLITLGTIEEKMETLKARKQALVAGILNAEAGATLKMTEADVEALFDA
jgi:superfamily II DNA or RNA helicase